MTMAIDTNMDINSAVLHSAYAFHGAHVCQPHLGIAPSMRGLMHPWRGLPRARLCLLMFRRMPYSPVVDDKQHITLGAGGGGGGGMQGGKESRSQNQLVSFA